MSQAIRGVAMIAAGAAMGVLGVMTGGALLANPFYDQLMASLIIGGVAMEAGAIANLLMTHRGVGITSRQTAAYRQIIYGEQRVPGVIVYQSTTGGHHDQYNYIVVLAGHVVDSIVNMYLDGRQVFWDTNNTSDRPSFANTTRNGVNFGGYADGADHIGPGGQKYNFGGQVFVEARFGDQPDGDVLESMTANDPAWATSSLGSPWLGGCCYVYVKIQFNLGLFPQPPEMRFTIRGKNNIFDPRVAPPPALTLLVRPTTLLNGWGNNAHVGAYELGQDQGFNFGLNDDTTFAYTSPDNAVDGSATTSASCIFQHTHKYAGCVWSFAALGTVPATLYLNVLSEVQAINGAARSAGIWYSLDGGTSWTQVYNSALRAKQWDSIVLDPTQDCSQVQVMAFLDSHDDMDHYVYDIQLATGPQNSTTSSGYTSNWALIVADVLTDPVFGLGDVGSVNTAQLIAAANVCDEQVALAHGGTESRYCCHWHYDTAVSPADILQTMMPAAMGRLSRIGGEWYIWPAYWQGPSYTFDASIMTGPIKWMPYRSFRDLVNRVNGTYIAPNSPWNVAGNLYDSNGWYQGTTPNTFPFAFQPTNYPQYAQDALHGYASDALLAQDNNIQLPLQLTQNCVLSIAQAQRCAKIALLRNRAQGTGTFQMHLAAWQMQPLDVMLLNFPNNGWAGKQLEVADTKFTIAEENGASTVRFEVNVQETNQQIYEWSTAEELSVYDVPSNTGGAPFEIAPPSNLTLLSDGTTAILGADGVNHPRIQATWIPPDDSRVTGIQIQLQLASSPGDPTATISAAPTSIASGDSSTLTWSSTSAASATLNGAAVAVNGSQVVSPTSTTAYTFIAVSSTGVTATSSATVTVGAVDPTAAISASPRAITPGSSSTLRWSSANATSATLNGASVAVNGSQVVSPKVTTTYTFIASASGVTATASVTVTVSSSPPPPPPGAMVKGQGVNSFTSTHYPQGTPFVRLHDSGVRWALISPTTRGSYDWARMDLYTAKAAATGTKLVYCVADTPSWAVGPVPPPYLGAYGPNSNAYPNLTMLAEFVTALVTHCQNGDGTNKLYAVEAWNEWNAGNFLDPRTTPSQIKALGQTVYNAVKAVNPNVLVTTPTPCRNKTTIVQAMESILAVGAGAFCDVVTFHGYVPTGADPSTIGPLIDGVKASMVKWGIPNKLLWETESGWGANTTVSDANKPAYINSWLNIRAQKGVDASFWYQWDNTTHGTLWTAGGGVNPAGAAWIAWNPATAATAAVTPFTASPSLLAGAVVLDTGWVDKGTVDVSVTSTYIGGVIAGNSYNVRIRSVTATGATSVWVEAGPVLVTSPSTTQSTYTNLPQIALSQPTPTTIHLAAVATTFGSQTVHYGAQTVTIPAPSVPTWYFVTLADPTQSGDSSPVTAAVASTSTALAGVNGQTYMGAILALPAGGATRILAGGWPAPITIQVG